jgi:large subunit ribosomal protein L13
MEEGVRVIDAENCVLGRLASIVAKRLLLGEKIIVINAEKAIVTGSKERILERFKAKRERGDPIKGPFYPVRPDRVFKRVVRGMLPRKKYKGRMALKRLKVYIGNPLNVEGEKVGKTIDDIRCKFMYLGDICRHLGWKG